MSRSDSANHGGKGFAAVFVRRPVFTWVLGLLTVVLGLAALQGLGLERYPNVDVPWINVTTLAAGLSAGQVESEVTAKIETAIGTVSGLERIDSTSQEGQSLVYAQFVLEKKSDVAAQEVRDRIARIAAELPPTVRPPQVETFNPNSAPVLLLSMRSPRGTVDPVRMTDLAETLVRRELQAVKGIGDVRIFGARKRALRVDLDPARLASFGLAPADISSALARDNLVVAGGDLPAGDRSLPVRLDAKATSRDELAAIVVAKRGRASVHLADVAAVTDGVETPVSTSLVSGEPALVLGLIKQSGENTVRVVDDVRERLQDLGARLPDDVELTVVRDEAVFVRASLHAVQEHLILGAIFAAAVVFLFLRNGRATLIAGLAIPTSVIGTFAIVKALGLTLNMLTLLGLTLAVGIVIDDAIVVLENVVRIIRSTGLPPQKAAVVATREITLAVLATTLSLVAVFLPIAFMGGLVGRFLASFGITMSVSILLSMAVAFTLTPMLCGRWLRPDAHPPAESSASLPPADPRDERAIYRAWARGERKAPDADHAPGFIDRIYMRMLAWAMLHRGVVLVGLAITLVSTVPLGMLVPKTFLPAEDEGRFEIYLRFEEGTSIDATELGAERLARAVRALPGIERTVVTVGSPRGDASGRGPNEAMVYVSMNEPGTQAATMQRVRNEIVPGSNYNGAYAFVGQVSDIGGSGTESAAVQYVMRGPDLAVLADNADKLLAEARKIPRTTDHGTSSTQSGPQLAVRVDRVKARELGIAHIDVGDALSLVGRSGLVVGSVRGASVDRSIDVILRIDSGLAAPEEQLRAVDLRTASGGLVPLQGIARFERIAAPGQIRHVDRQRQVTVFLNALPGVGEDEVVAALDVAYARIGAPPGYRAEVLGNAREMEKAAASFALATTLSVVFMYLVLAAQFESWLVPVTILMSLPLTVPFALLSLGLSGQTLNLFSALGMLVLFGIVKKNSILQIDHTLALERSGYTRPDAVMVANLHRLRPILMTTLAFVAGLVPLVVATGAGAGTNRAIGVGVLGGQTLSLLLTLLATPVVFTVLEDVRAWTARLVGRLRGFLSRGRGSRGSPGSRGAAHAVGPS
ncbi:efflux RND transporter permease subunit [Pendulispora albinea]|uniref:Efflux RND transporter permease subunit n=1 Tax=Pendulispora albinea TaxID=2741071 RepID=A0ABZ2MAK3_9BACT